MPVKTGPAVERPLVMELFPSSSPRSAAELAADLERRIVAGQLPAGWRLDPVRTAAERMKLAPNTVAAAYRTLADRGLVVGRGRRGTFVEERRPIEQLVPEIPGGVTDLASGRPDPSLLPDLAPILAALDGSTTTYGDPAIAPELEATVRTLLDGDGIPSRHLAVAGGAVDGIERALATRLRPGDGVAVEDPGWFATSDLVRSMGLVPVPVAVDDDGMIPGALAAVAGRVGGVIVTSRSQNPTGAATSETRAAELTDVVASHPELLVIEDDHMDDVGGGSLNPIGPGATNWTYIRSFSKSLGPDLRMAIVAGDAVTIDRFAARQMVGPGWVSHILQRSTAALLTSSVAAAGRRYATEVYAARRRSMMEALRREGGSPSGGTGLNLWLPVEDEEGAVRRARAAGFAIRAGRKFRHAAPPGVRITISMLDEKRADEVAAAILQPTSSRHCRPA